MVKAPAPALVHDLERLLAGFPYARSLPMDPLAQVIPWAGDRRAAEIVGVLASTVAVGNVKSIRTDLSSLLARLGQDPRGFVEEFPRRSWRTLLSPWRHRWIRGDQMGFLLLRLGELYERYPGGLEELFLEGAEGPGPEERFAAGVHALSRGLRYGGPGEPRSYFEPPLGYLRLFPSPREGGHPACKREVLFLRWMVRRSPPDLGLWTRVDPSILHVPLDTHVYWIARHLGLTRRASRNWPTVVEITRALRAMDPGDPVRFDFALAHTGISGDCPKRPDPSICGRCAVQPHCDLWRGTRSRRLPRARGA